MIVVDWLNSVYLLEATLEASSSVAVIREKLSPISTHIQILVSQLLELNTVENCFIREGRLRFQFFMRNFLNVALFFTNS